MHFTQKNSVKTIYRLKNFVRLFKSIDSELSSVTVTHLYGAVRAHTEQLADWLLCNHSDERRT